MDPVGAGASDGLFQHGIVYDLLFRGNGKDYEAEADTVGDLIRVRRPDADSLLDVGCGTGTHLTWFRRKFARVEGLDAAEDMVRVARAKLPGVPVHLGDMRDFTLDRRFAAVTCLFSSIAYLRGPDEIAAAISRLGEHLEVGGVAVVEPWYFPGTAPDRDLFCDLYESDGLTVARIACGIDAGEVFHIGAHYLVASPGEGIRHFADTHELTLMARERYEEAFRSAGMSVTYVPSPKPDLLDCGLFVGVRD